MSNLEQLGAVVSDAAIRAADEATKPLSKQIKSLGNSIGSADRIAREAIKQSDQVKVESEKRLTEQEAVISRLRVSYVESMKAYLEAIEGVKASGVLVESRIAGVSEDQEKHLAEVNLEITKLRANMESALDDINAVEAKIIERGDIAIDRLSALHEEAIKEFEGGVKGDPGDPGSPGVRGPKGEPGVMASPERWVSDKLYKAGSTALHRGGTFYCEVVTVDEPGDTPAWTCIANGVDVESSFVEDGVKTDVYADGQRIEYRVIPRHVGVFKEGERYIKSDQVTWNGSLYSSIVDNPDQHPGKKLDDGVDTQWSKILSRGQKGPRGNAGDPADAAAIVYSQIEQDINQASHDMEDYLGGLSL